MRGRATWRGQGRDPRKPEVHFQHEMALLSRSERFLMARNRCTNAPVYLPIPAHTRPTRRLPFLDDNGGNDNDDHRADPEADPEADVVHSITAVVLHGGSQVHLFGRACDLHLLLVYEVFGVDGVSAVV